MQTILEEGKLLNEDGNLVQTGYSTFLAKSYNRFDIKTKASRIKETDSYYILNSKHGVILTICDVYYASICSLSFIDFEKNKITTKSVRKLFSFGKLDMPNSSRKGDILFNNKRVQMSFKHENGKRHLNCFWKDFSDKNKDLRLDLYLEETNKDSIVTANSLAKIAYFSYNQKINLMKSNGYVKIGDNIFDFNTDTFGVLNWERGSFTFKNAYVWSSLSGSYEGKRIGFNFGYGTGNNSTHTENIFFIEDKSFKLEDVHFDIPIDKHGKDSYLETWKFRSSSGDVNIKFIPTIYEYSKIGGLFLKSSRHTIFGKFSGYVLIDGKEYFFTDMLGFAKKVNNKW